MDDFDLSTLIAYPDHPWCGVGDIIQRSNNVNGERATQIPHNKKG